MFTENKTPNPSQVCSFTTMSILLYREKQRNFLQVANYSVLVINNVIENKIYEWFRKSLDYSKLCSTTELKKGFAHFKHELQFCKPTKQCMHLYDSEMLNEVIKNTTDLHIIYYFVKIL